MFTDNARQQHGTPVHVYEQEAGLEVAVGMSFANLLISAEGRLLCSRPRVELEPSR